MEIISLVGDGLSVSLLFYGFFIWLRDCRRLMAPVTIVLFCDTEEVAIPYRILRRDLSRPEVAGVLGFYSVGRRYALPGLAGVFSDGQYRRVLQGKSDTLRISAPRDEFLLFKAAIEGEKK